MPAKLVDVIPLGVDQRFRPGPDQAATELRARCRLGPRVVLALGKDFPQKNLDTLLRAWTRLGSAGGLAHELVLAGERRVDRTGDRLDRLIGESSLGGRVRLLGHVPDEDLPALYRCAELSVYPSRYEAFGLPPLEAMASGVPVVAARAGSLPEVLGPAACFVDPMDPDAVAQAIKSVLEDDVRRAELVRRGLDHVRGLTWQATAARTRAVYDAVLLATPATRDQSRRVALMRLALRAGRALERQLVREG